MRLTDLDPEFLRYEERVETWTEVDRQPLPGESLDTVPTHQVTGQKQYNCRVERIQEAQGVGFLCPVCFKINNGPIGTHGVICWSRSRGVPDHALPGPGRWLLVGTGFHDLTLDGDGFSRSILLTNGDGCTWHGYITGGEVTEVT